MRPPSLSPLMELAIGEISLSWELSLMLDKIMVMVCFSLYSLVK